MILDEMRKMSRDEIAVKVLGIPADASGKEWLEALDSAEYEAGFDTELMDVLYWQCQREGE
jgi:hypothetical protein